jgi:Hg(II)-responsive transcriptional regulator
MEETATGHMLIGTLAEAAGVGVETLRFYEREGLLPEPPRSDSGYRLYDEDAVRRVRFIRKAKGLGFTLSETKELLELRVTDTDGCDEIAARARRKIARIEDRLRELRRIKWTLRELVRACAENEHTGECPILDALDERESGAIGNMKKRRE